MSADEAFVFDLADEGRTVDRGELYAIGRIVLFAPHGSPLKPDASFADLKAALTDGRIARFAIANPEHAPYGRAGRAGAGASGLWDAHPAAPGARRECQPGRAVRHQRHRRRAASSRCRSRWHRRWRRLGTYVTIPGRVARRLAQRMVLIKGAGETMRRFYSFVQDRPARAHLPALRVRAARRTGLIRRWIGPPLACRCGSVRSASLVLLPIGVILARVLAFRHFAGKGFAEAALALPLVLPPTVSAIYMLVTFGGALAAGQSVCRPVRPQPGRSASRACCWPSVIVNLPFAVQPMQRAFEAIAARGARGGCRLAA